MSAVMTLKPYTWQEVAQFAGLQVVARDVCHDWKRSGHDVGPFGQFMVLTAEDGQMGLYCSHCHLLLASSDNPETG